MLTASEGGLAGSLTVIENPTAFVGTATGAEFNTLVFRMTPIACWRVDDVRFLFASSFPGPDLKDEIEHLMLLREEHKIKIVSKDAPGTPVFLYPRLSLFGHADPVGDDDYNKQLSGRRAAAIYGLLTRDAGLWEELYSQPLGKDQWDKSAAPVMLAQVGYAGSDAVRQFQEAHGLTPDGVAGSKTRAQLFVAYMDSLAGPGFRLDKHEDFLAGTDEGGKGDYQGCSEFNPVLLFSQKEEQEFTDDPKREARDDANAPNRRVTGLLFRPGSAVLPKRWPCPRVKEGVAGCHLRFWSDGDRRRTTKLPDTRREYKNTADTFACRFYHRLSNTSPCEALIRSTTSVWIGIQPLLADPLPETATILIESSAGDKLKWAVRDGERRGDGLLHFEVVRPKPGVTYTTTLRVTATSPPQILFRDYELYLLTVQLKTGALRPPPPIVIADAIFLSSDLDEQTGVTLYPDPVEIDEGRLAQMRRGFPENR